MLGPAETRAASDLLFECWQEGRLLDCLPGHLRPATREEGYAIQAHLEKYSASPIFGWKIAATSVAGQTHIGVDGPMAGRILAERVMPPGASVPLGANHMRVAEVEIAFRMGRDLAPREEPYREEEVLAAVETLHPAIELPDSRYDDFASVGAPQLIADNACAHLFLLGEATSADWRALDLASHETQGRKADGTVLDGKGANVLGSPCVALTWLANELSLHGLTLKAGQIVSTGTTTIPIAIGRGDEVTADLGLLGSLSVRIL